MCASTQTHQLLRERATERYENYCDEAYPLADGYGRARIFIFDLMLGEKTFFRKVAPRSGFYGHLKVTVFQEVAPPSVCSDILLLKNPTEAAGYTSLRCRN